MSQESIHQVQASEMEVQNSNVKFKECFDC